DRIFDFGGNFDELRFGAGINADQGSRTRSGDDLVLQLGNASEVAPADVVTIANWFTDPSFQIEKASFADGTIWDAATLASLRLLGTPFDDFLSGDPTTATLIEGFEGNDQLLGGFGNDTLDGGTVFFLLQGNGGDDVFPFTTLSRSDRIFDFGGNFD